MTTTMTTSATMATMVMTIMVRAVFFHSQACRNVIWAKPWRDIYRLGHPNPSLG